MEEPSRKKKTPDVAVQRVDLIFLITQLRDSINAQCPGDLLIHKRKMAKVLSISKVYLGKTITDAIHKAPRKNSHPGG